jgi:predicted nucleic acid-binding protein
MKAYLDNNVVSAIAKDDTETESDALDRILAAYEEGKVDLVTSDLTLVEIQQYAGPWRKPTERMFRLLEKVPVIPWHRLLGIHSYNDAYTSINSPMIENDALYDLLLALGVEPVDAQHVFVAAKQDCLVFLTCDRGILTVAENIQELCGLAVQKPSDLVTGQGW